MKNTIDFKEKKARMNGEVTPKSVIENLMKAIDIGDIESVIYVVKQTDGEIKTGYSKGGSLQMLGLLKCGGDDLISYMKE